MSSTSLQNTIIGVLSLVLLALGYFLFVQPNTFSSVLDTTNPLDDAVFTRTQEFIARRSELDQIKIEDSIFTDSRFTSLRSYTTPLLDQQLGKTSVFDKPASLKTVTAAANTPAQ